MIIWETFLWPGNYPVLNILLKMRVIAFLPTSGNSFKIRPVISSYCGTFVGRNRFVINLTSEILNFLTGVFSRLGVSRACKISYSSSLYSLESYGLKTFA
jgi:hypothetical protein